MRFLKFETLRKSSASSDSETRVYFLQADKPGFTKVWKTDTLVDFGVKAQDVDEYEITKIHSGAVGQFETLNIIV
jgi:hypothetical protein